MNDTFRKIAHRVSLIVGSPAVFLLALAVVIIWAVSGPLFNFSDTWQLVINTGTTIVTFLMVFLIQNTQNRDAMAMHLKLDELIRSLDQADNALMRAEDETDEELAELKRKYAQLVNMHSELVDVHAELKNRLHRQDGAQTG